MKILVVHEIGYWGGPVFEFQEFTEGFLEAGHEVIVLDLNENNSPRASSGESPSSGAGTRGRSSNQVVNVVTPTMTFSNNWLRPLAVPIHLHKLLSIFLTWRPDVVFSYSVPTSGVSVALLAKIFRVPSIHRAIDVSHKLRPGIYESAVRLAEKATFRMSDFVSTHNDALAGYVRANGARPDRVTIQYPPVDIEYFGSTMGRDTGVAQNVIFVGTLADHCGLDKVIQSLHHLSDRLHNWRLRIVGDGPMAQKLHKLALDSPHSERIEFRGWVDYSRLAGEMAWATVAIIPFEKNQLTDLALPQKTIQYLAAGLPVVSTKLLASVGELSDCKSLRFVESPEDVMAVALDAPIYNDSDREWLATKFAKSKAIDEMIVFLERARMLFKK